MTARILTGDCRALAPTLERKADAVITDAPYELGFMGKAWDRSGIAFAPDTWRVTLEAAKPGAHLVAFGGTRTHHRMMVAIEDAGWEIRDCLMWLYGSGFPKSLDVSKAIDKAAGAAREEIGRKFVGKGNGRGPGFGHDGTVAGVPVTAPATDAAEQWAGWGTALKPGWEPIILARKPLDGTVAANVQAHGTGALNIDGCRIPGDNPSIERRSGSVAHLSDRPARESEAAGRLESRQSPEAYRAERPGELIGRWPANVVLDEEAAALLDEQSGELVSGANPERRGSPKTRNSYGAFVGQEECVAYRGVDRGGASRFFYCAKASRAERNRGLEGFEKRIIAQHRQAMNNGSGGLKNGTGMPLPGENHHPTVKPVDLMRWLVRLVTPRGGLVLDPFCGSGSTGIAAVAEGCDFLGIELNPEYAEIARARIHAEAPLFTQEAG